MEEIIKIVAKSKSFGITGNTEHQFSQKNKNCGDHIKIEFDFKDEQIFILRYEGETCIYCQASAALIANSTKKIELKKLVKLQNQIYEYFNNYKNKKWEYSGFKKLLKKNNSSRKECIALPLNAILNSLKNNDNK